MSIFRTIAMFLYLFGYMIVHYGTLRRGERALAAGVLGVLALRLSPRSAAAR